MPFVQDETIRYAMKMKRHFLSQYFGADARIRQEFVCEWCQKHFRSTRKDVMFCSPTCRSHYRYRDSRWQQFYKCKNCEQLFRPKPNGDNQCLFCSRSCAFAYRAQHGHFGKARKDVVSAIAKAISDGMLLAKVAWKQCRFCHCTYWRSVKKSKPGFCSYRCRKNSLTITDENHCNKCGALLDRDGNTCISCIRQVQRESNRDRTWRKKAQKYNVQYAFIRRDTIFKRDAWRCHICGKKTKPNWHYLHPLYPTLDHIIPISRGGAHIESNVACAHRMCNTRKRSRRLGNLRLM